MSSKKENGGLGEHLSDLFVYGLILGILLVALRSGCIVLDLSPGVEQTTNWREEISPEDVLAALESKSMLCSAEADVEVMLHHQRDIQRFLFPDSHLEVTMRLSGVVRAAVNLGELINGDMEISRTGGVTRAFVRLPTAEIVSVRLSLPSASWDFSSDLLQLWTRDGDALEIREELLVEARSVLSERAIQSGLLLEAERSAVRTVTDTIKELGVDQVEVVIT